MSRSSLGNHLAKNHYPVALLIFFLALSWAAHSEDYFWWDLDITRWLQSFTDPRFRKLMEYASIPGNGFWNPTTLIAAVSFGLLVAGKRLESACCVMSSSGWPLSFLVKWLVARPRPSAGLVQVSLTTAQASFPSGHLVHYVTFYGFVLWLALRRVRSSILRCQIGIVCGLLILLIGPSRIYLGAHWASDVLGGYLMGSVWLWLAARTYLKHSHVALHSAIP